MTRGSIVPSLVLAMLLAGALTLTSASTTVGGASLDAAALRLECSACTTCIYDPGKIMFYDVYSPPNPELWKFHLQGWGCMNSENGCNIPHMECDDFDDDDDADVQVLARAFPGIVESTLKAFVARHPGRLEIHPQRHAVQVMGCLEVVRESISIKRVAAELRSVSN